MFIICFESIYFAPLQSKDRLIASLKEGTVGLDGSGASEPMVLSTELESMRQERDILREDLHSSQMALENMRAELSVSLKRIFESEFSGLDQTIDEC